MTTKPAAKPANSGGDFVAYHSTEGMGYELEPVSPYSFYSRKSRHLLERSIGGTVWMITGTRDSNKRLIHRLVGKYTPSEVRDDESDPNLHIIYGEEGTSLQPPLILSELDWFQDLFRAQNKFSFGFNSIRGEEILGGLHAALIGASEFSSEAGPPLLEGTPASVIVTSYERNPVAREQCLQYYGNTCFACGFSFRDTYGVGVTGCIHVHHLQSVAARGGEYIVDPIEDLRPVCPNCHAVLHSRKPPLSIQELKAMLAND
jgi:hypothetical protein